MFDKDGDDIISVKHLAYLLRTLGRNPTESEVLEMTNQVDSDGTIYGSLIIYIIPYIL